MTHTHQTVSDLIFSGWESDLPDKVLDALRPYDGKPITTRLLKVLPEIPHGWRLRREYGMTHIASWEYSRSSGSSDAKYSICLLLAHTESSVPLDLRYVEEKNTAYFSARKERNHARMEARNDRKVLDSIAAAMNDAERAIALMTNTVTRIETLTGYGTVLDPARYEILRACGLMDRDGRYFINHEYKDRAPRVTVEE